MLQKVFPVILQKFPFNVGDSSNLVIGLERSILEAHRILNYNDDVKSNFFIGAFIREYPILYKPFNCTIIEIQILETNEQLDDVTIPLYVNDAFLQQQNLTFNDVCYLKAVICLPLERIVFGAKTPESISWFQDSEKYSTLVKIVNEQNVLCCLGKTPSVQFDQAFTFDDLTVLDCQPVRQGLLSSKSSIIIADIRDIQDQGKVNKSKNIATKIPDVTPIVELTNLTNSNILGIRPPSPQNLPFNSAISIIKALPTYQIQIITKLNLDFEKELKKLGEDIDVFNFIFLSLNSPFKHGSWVKIGIKGPEVKIKGDSHISGYRFSASLNKRIARVCVLSRKSLSKKYFSPDDVVYISPLLWFNMNKQPSLLIQPYTRLQIEPLDPGFEPPVAVEAYACLIQSPYYDGKINCAELIKKYFSIPRFVCRGDIFSLNSKEQVDFHSKIQDDEVDKLVWPVVHFRIARVDGATTLYGHLLSSKVSRLYQSGTKQSYVPVTMETYYQLSSYHPIWNAVPNGLAEYINKLQDLILPFLKLQKKSLISPNFLFTGPPCCGKTTVVKAVCRCLNLHLYQINCHEFTGETTAVVEARLRNKFHKGSSYAPCVILLKNVHSIGRDKEALSEDSRVIHTLSNLLKEANGFSSEWPIIVIGTAVDQKQLSGNLMSAFLHSVQMTAPNEEERCLILEDLLTVCEVGNDISVRYLAQRTAGFVLGDLCALINQGIKNSYKRIRKLRMEKQLTLEQEEDIVLASVPVLQRDLLNALEKLQSEFADAIGAPKIPNVKFEDVGGLAVVKQEILDTIQLPLEHPEILSSGLRRSGVLLYGPPGSGKTLLAKAVATECSLNFLSVKGPELINMYVGQSEENVRAVFSQARNAVPCIIFFDELDSLAPNRGRSGDSGGVMDRVVSQLLTELDGLNKKSEVFVIGATNRPDLLDPALLRPGRFDRLLYVGIPEDNRSKLSILKALTRKFPLAPDVKLAEIVKMFPPHLSGADFYALCSNAVIQRVEKNVEMIEKGEIKIEDVNCEVSTEDFLVALKTIVPSVSPEQYMEYLAIRSKIEQE